MTSPRFLNLPKLHCRRCDHKWWPRPWAMQGKLPKRCPNCTSPYWNTPYKRGPKRGYWKRKKKLERLAAQTAVSMTETQQEEV